jgi:hypothetical protein
MRSIAHAEEMLYTQFGSEANQDPGALGPFVKRAGEYGLWLTPTLSNYAALTRQWGKPLVVEQELRASTWTPYLHPEIVAFWTIGNGYPLRKSDPTIMERNLVFLRALVKRLSEEGVHLVLGTDSPLPLLVPGRALHDEIEELLRAGLPARAILAAGTKNAGEYAAEFLGEKDRFGVIALGARADLLVVEKNPLDDLTTLSAPLGVMARGHWYSKATLTRALQAIARHYSELPKIAAITVEPQRLAAYEGTFSKPGESFALKFAVENGRLTAQPVGAASSFGLVPTGTDEFRVAGIPMRVAFTPEADAVTVFEDFNDPLQLRRR